MEIFIPYCALRERIEIMKRYLSTDEKSCEGEEVPVFWTRFLL